MMMLVDRNAMRTDELDVFLHTITDAEQERLLAQ